MLLFANIAGFIVCHARYFMIGAAIAVLAVAIVITSKSCSPKPKLDAAAVQKAQEAIADHDRSAMVSILVDSDTKAAAIDANRLDAETQKINAIYAAKKKFNDMTNDELAAELEARK